MKLKLTENYKIRLETLAGLNENQSNSIKFVLGLSPDQFYKFIDLMESDISMYGFDDFNYYSEITNIPVETLLDYYTQLGFNLHKREKTEMVKQLYEKNNNISWEEIKAIADSTV